MLNTHPYGRPDDLPVNDNDTAKKVEKLIPPEHPEGSVGHWLLRAKLYAEVHDDRDSASKSIINRGAGSAWVQIYEALTPSELRKPMSNAESAIVNAAVYGAISVNPDPQIMGDPRFYFTDYSKILTVLTYLKRQ